MAFSDCLLGICTLWLLLALAACGLVASFPAEVPARWLGDGLDIAETLRYAAFLATVGVLAGALGGSLETEGKFKAMLYFDDDEV